MVPTASILERSDWIVPFVLVAAVGNLRGAIEVRILMILADRSGVDLGGQRDGSRSEDQCGDQGLGKHGTSPLVLGRAWSDTRPLVGTNIPHIVEIEREVAHADGRESFRPGRASARAARSMNCEPYHMCCAQYSAFSPSSNLRGEKWLSSIFVARPPRRSCRNVAVASWTKVCNVSSLN